MATPRRTEDSGREDKGVLDGNGMHTGPIYEIPNRDDDGWTRYFSEEAARAAITEEDIEYALGAIGAWSDLDEDETLAALDEIRHRNSPSSPVTDETLGLG